MAQIGTVMKYLKEIDRVIAELRRGMQHTSPYSVDYLRFYVNELENIKESILNSRLESDMNLEHVFEKVRTCIRHCVRPEYTGKPEVLGKPKPTPWKPPVTVTGVNIIFVVDISASMFKKGGGLEPGGRVRKMLVDMANAIDATATEAGIPTKVSLVAYADPTDRAGKNRPKFWDIVLNKEDDVSKLSNAFSNINRDKWAIGADLPESGMSAIYHTVQTVFDNSIVNGKPVENSLILVSDERQKLHGGNPGSHPRYKEVTGAELKKRLDGLGLKNTYALFPTTNGRNKQNIPYFRQTRDYFQTKDVSSLSDWITWTLDPTQAP